MNKKETSDKYRKEHYKQIKIEIDKNKAEYYKEYAKFKNISMPKLICNCLDEHIENDKDFRK